MRALLCVLNQGARLTFPITIALVTRYTRATISGPDTILRAALGWPLLYRKTASLRFCRSVRRRRASCLILHLEQPAAELHALRVVRTAEAAFAPLALVRSGPAVQPHGPVGQALAQRVAERHVPVVPVARSGPVVVKVAQVARVVAQVARVAAQVVAVPVARSVQAEMVIVEATDVVRQERPQAPDQGQPRRQSRQAP